MGADGSDPDGPITPGPTPHTALTPGDRQNPRMARCGARPGHGSPDRDRTTRAASWRGAARGTIVALTATIVAGCAAAPTSAAAPRTGVPDLRVDVLADGLDNVWDMGFLPDGRVLFTERDGRL